MAFVGTRSNDAHRTTDSILPGYVGQLGVAGMLWSDKVTYRQQRLCVFGNPNHKTGEQLLPTPSVTLTSPTHLFARTASASADVAKCAAKRWLVVPLTRRPFRQ
jgi:hypothetical protein